MPNTSRALLVTSLLLLACDSKKETKPEVPPPTASSPAASSPGAPSAGPEKPPSAVPAGHHSAWSKGNPTVQGPELIVDPGNGISAIRFGTNFDVLARHMGAPCDVRTEARCLYVDRAVDFGMKDGVVASMKIHRRDRLVPNVPDTRYFGSFHGRVLPSIMLGLHRHIVEEEYGAPLEREKVDPPTADGTVERHRYPGLVFEYDRIENGNVVLSAIEVIREKVTVPGGKRDASKTGASKTGAAAPAASTSPKRPIVR